MEWISYFVDLFLHLDRHLNEVIQDYGLWTYLILFLIIFCETGLVVTPLLPGDSLLFAAGALAASEGSPLDVNLLFILLTVGAILGDTVNYWIGAWVGPKIFYKEKVRFFKKEYLERTHRFYEKYGGKTIIMARFVPIIRTFAPFVAGIGSMTYWRFILYNITGGIAWVAICIYSGYLFGNIPIVKSNFSIVILVIVFISILPGLIEYGKHRFRKSRTEVSEHAVLQSKDEQQVNQVPD
ncbi:MAG: DedA family protein [Blastocatellia bacterium]|nr:DedA family protein [Blastocatellia bacterium]